MPVSPLLPGRPRLRLRSPGLRLRLVALAGGATLAVLGLAAIAVWEAYAAARDRAATQLLGTTRALARVVDGEFGRAEALLLGLASSLGPDGTPPDGFATQLRQAAAAFDQAPLILAGRDGRIRAASWATPEQIAAGVRMMPGLAAVFGTGRPVITDLGRSPTTGAPLVAVGIPVRAADGSVAGLLAMGMPLPRLTAALVSQRLPDEWVAAVLDRTGTIVARTRRQEEVVGRQATPVLAAALAAGDEGPVSGSRNHDGEPTVSAFARAPVSGYAVALGAPRAEFDADRARALRQVGVAGTVLVAAALLAATLLARRLGAALRAVGPDGAGRTGVREVDELARALAEAAAARDAAAAALRERSARFEASQRAARVGSWHWAPDTGVVEWSEQEYRLHGLDPSRAGPPSYAAWMARLHPEDRGRVATELQAALATGTLESEYRVVWPDGAVRWLRAQAALERDAAGAPRRLDGINLDVTERRALEAEHERLLREKDLLVAEVNHRVKNSLQLVHGLLLLQARGAPEAAAVLRGAARRVLTVAAVHRRLYEGDSATAAEVAPYLAGLVEELRGALAGEAERPIRLEAEAGLHLPADRLALLGIAVTELVTNALKHGAGAVTVRCRRLDGQVELVVEDEGPGFPPDFAPERATGLGMKVATALARQRGGGLRVDRAAPGGRIVVTIGLPAPPGDGLPAPPEGGLPAPSASEAVATAASPTRAVPAASS